MPNDYTQPVITPSLNDHPCGVPECTNEANFAVMVELEAHVVEADWLLMLICNDHLNRERDKIVAIDRKLDV